MRIVAIDPGISIGWAQVWNPTGNEEEISTRTIDTRVVSLAKFYKDLYNFCPSIIICEQFILVPHGKMSSDGMQTLRISGGVHAVAHLIDAVLKIQYPQQRTYMLPKAKEFLIAQHGGKRTFSEHQLDALAHLFAFQDKKT